MTIAAIARTTDPETWPTTVVAERLDNELVTASITTDSRGIAVGVNDIVIRNLFSIGLSLQSTRTTMPEAERNRLDKSIDELDVAIRELRSLIFDLIDRGGTTPT